MPSYQLAISNIAWQKDDDETVYAAMQQAGFTGLELAPTRIFSEAPYENLTSALLFGGYLKNRWGFSVPSLQSIWYGQKGNIYTAQAFQFAHSLNCPSLVFGCPKNRMRPLGANDAAAEAFFMQAGNLAARYGVHLALEANPPMYTNYLNGTADAFALVKRLDNPGLSVNLDLSTVLAQGEHLQSFIDDMQYVSHVHISEPGLVPIERRPEHKELALLLGAVGYRGGVRMIEYERTNLNGVPDYTAVEFEGRRHDYCLLIPVINEGARILTELGRAQKAGIDQLCDIVICDGGSTDGSMKRETLALYHVNTLLTKTGPGRQGAQLRMGMYFALDRNYKGILTIDGNNKDSIEDVPEFIAKLQEGYDLVQGSRFIRGGHAINTPPVRYAAVRLIHAPLVSLGAHQWFTDTTNAYRAYSREYLTHPDVRPLRDVFGGYELLAYLSIRATQLGLKACEVPVTRAYPATGKTPTKISGFKGNSDLMKVLLNALAGKYNP